jgi:hypothetical protein
MTIKLFWDRMTLGMDKKVNKLEFAFAKQLASLCEKVGY